MSPPPLTVLERILVALELIIGVSAVVGGALLALDPSGHTVGLRVDLLAGTGFASFLVPGILLLVANGALPLVVAAATIRQRRWAGSGHLAVGLVLFVWLGIQTFLLGRASSLQPTLLLLAVLIAVLGAARLRGGLDLG